MNKKLVIDGHKAVDLGLSVKWATCNLGAESPDSFGNFYKWGETEPSEDDSWEKYKYYDIKRDTHQRIGYEISGTQFDAVRKSWGNNWRMPTFMEVCELRRCTWKWGVLNGVYGYYVTGHNGNSIFLPVCNLESIQNIGSRDYWTGTMGDDDPIISEPICLTLEVYDSRYPNSIAYSNESSPCFCLPIRPVIDI